MWDFHCKDKTLMKPPYLDSGDSFTGKTTSLRLAPALSPKKTKQNKTIQTDKQQQHQKEQKPSNYTYNAQCYPIVNSNPHKYTPVRLNYDTFLFKKIFRTKFSVKCRPLGSCVNVIVTDKCSLFLFVFLWPLLSQLVFVFGDPLTWRYFNVFLPLSFFLNSSLQFSVEGSRM